MSDAFSAPTEMILWIFLLYSVNMVNCISWFLAFNSWNKLYLIMANTLFMYF